MTVKDPPVCSRRSRLRYHITTGTRTWRWYLRVFHGAAREVMVVVGMKRGVGLRGTHGTGSQPRPHHEDRCGCHRTQHGLGCSAFGRGTRTLSCWLVSRRSESLVCGVDVRGWWPQQARQRAWPAGAAGRPRGRLHGVSSRVDHSLHLQGGLSF